MSESSFFFSDDEVEDVALTNIERILKLEKEEAAKVMKLYRKVSRELQQELKSVPEGTFTHQKMRATLMQLNTALKSMNGNLKNEMLDSSEKASFQGVEDLIKEVEKWNSRFKGAVVPMNVNAIAEAIDTKAFLFNKYEESITRYDNLLRARMSRDLTESVIAQEQTSDVIKSLGKVLAGEEWKLEQIVRTELHGMYGRGKLRGMEELWGNGNGDIPDLKKTLFHPMDRRTGEDSKRLAQDNPIVPIDQPFVEYSLGHRSEYMAPPNRPNDRAILIPYRESWSQK